MVPTNTDGYSFSAGLEDERATRRLMADIAAQIEPGDLITLSGDLGAGKTTFARALIRHLAGDQTIEVPSPTFTLVQSYELPRFQLLHADLYRLSGPGELGELGFEDAPGSAVTLMEWPDRAGDELPRDRLDIAFTLSAPQGETFRHAHITGYGACAARAERIARVRDFLANAGFGEATRQRIQGDASTRSYERLTLNGAHFILMNSPKRPDGPPVHNGKPYSQIAHLAEDVTPFVAMGKALRALGLSAPVHLRCRSRGRAVAARGLRQRICRGRRSAGADRGALRGRRRSVGGAASRTPAGCTSGRARPHVSRCRATIWTRC